MLLGTMNVGVYLAVISVVASLANGQFKAPNHLHPVHGLYVKPSADGTTGDLYVAATEDSGTTTQWLTDQPINFLPAGAATQQIKTTVPFPKEEGSTQKRAVITSPPVQYAYALPFSGGSTEGAVVPYPYVVPTAVATQTSAGSSDANPCDATTTAFPYNPFQFFYPHMMSAYANAKSILKESGMNDDKAGALVSQASPMWSPYGAYPMYVMVDPSAWANMQGTTTASTTSTTNDN